MHSPDSLTTIYASYLGIPTIIRGGGSIVVLKNGMYLGQGSVAIRFLSSQNVGQG